MLLQTIKKRSLRVGLMIVFSMFFVINAMAVEFFVNSDKPNNGKIIHFFKCDNNRMIKIIHLGGNRYQFYSIGGNDIMERKTAVEVAAYVCKNYLRTQ